MESPDRLDKYIGNNVLPQREKLSKLTSGVKAQLLFPQGAHFSRDSNTDCVPGCAPGKPETELDGEGEVVDASRDGEDDGVVHLKFASTAP